MFFSYHFNSIINRHLPPKMPTEERHVDLDALQLIKDAVVDLQKHSGLCGDHDGIWHFLDVQAPVSKNATKPYASSLIQTSALLTCLHIQTV